MKVGKRKVLSAALAAMVACIAGVAWIVGGSDLLLAVVLATLVAGLGALGFLVVHTERRIRAQVTREVTREVTRKVDAALAPQLKSLATKLERPGNQFEAMLRAIKASHARLDSRLTNSLSKYFDAQKELTVKQRDDLIDRIQAAIHEQGSALVEALEQNESSLMNALNSAERDTSSSLDALSRHHKEEVLAVVQQHRELATQYIQAPMEMDALFQIHRRTQLPDPLPIVDGMLPPSGILHALDLILRDNISTVVQCGSGPSTLFVARALEQQGDGRIVTLEHLHRAFDDTQDWIRQHGLTAVAEVRLAPLEEVEVDDESFLWYSPSSFADLQSIDLLIVNGPPRTFGVHARYPAFPLLHDRLSHAASVMIGNLGPNDEQFVVERWLGSSRLIEDSSVKTDVAVLRLNADDQRSD